MARRCSACSHPRVLEINARLRATDHPVVAEVAREFGLLWDALSRHLAHHVHAGQPATPAGHSAADARPVSEDGVADPVEDVQDVQVVTVAQQKPHAKRRPSHRGRAAHRAVPANARERFLLEYAASGNVSQAARAAGVGRKTVYTWQEHDETFALRFNEAEAEAVELLEQEARERATTGGKLVREVWRGDRLIERIVEYRPSDAVLVKLLQALRPEKYGDRLAVTQTQVVKTIDQTAWDSV